MNKMKCKASWWVLYLLIIGVFVAGWFEARSQLTTLQHQILEIGGLLVIYALISLWLRMNTGAIILDDFERYQAKNNSRKNSRDQNSNSGHRDNRIFFAKMHFAYRSVIRLLNTFVATIISIITQGN